MCSVLSLFQSFAIAIISAVTNNLIFGGGSDRFIYEKSLQNADFFVGAKGVEPMTLCL